MENSFANMREHERIDIKVSIHGATISEWIDSASIENDEPLNQIILNGEISSCRRIREYDQEIRISDKVVRVLILEKPYSDIYKLESKFPLGMLKFCNAETYIRVIVRPELFDKIAHNLSATISGGLSFDLSLPLAEQYEIDLYYPILSYGFRISVGNAT